MKTTMAFKAMADAIPYVAELLETPELKEFTANRKLAKDMNVSEMMQAILPTFLVTKPNTVFGLLGAMSGKTAEEIAEQDWTETRTMLKDPMLDDLFDFFIFAARTARNA